MINKEHLRAKFEAQLKYLPKHLQEDLRLEYNIGNSLHGVIDVVIYRGDECMALGFFQESVLTIDIAEKKKQFSIRFNRAMGYRADSWYLFGFDGNDLVINDLSFFNTTDEFPSSLDSGVRRLCTLPKQWHAEKKTLDDMQRYLEAIRDMISEERIANNVN